MKKGLAIACVVGLFSFVSLTGCSLMSSEAEKGGMVKGIETAQNEEEILLADFYFGVLCDLYEKDSGLNDGVEMIALDLTALTNLGEAGKAELISLAEEKFEAEIIEKTYEELVDEGYILNPNEFPEFENGLALSFSNVADEGNNGKSFSFSVQKWRTALGAYGFSDCKAVKKDDGWTYTIGTEFIS